MQLELHPPNIRTGSFRLYQEDSMGSTPYQAGVSSRREFPPEAASVSGFGFHATSSAHWLHCSGDDGCLKSSCKSLASCSSPHFGRSSTVPSFHHALVLHGAFGDGGLQRR